MLGLGRILERTFRLDEPIADMKSLMPELCRTAMRAAMEIRSNEVSFAVPEASNALPASTKARTCTQHPPSVKARPVLIRRPRKEKCPGFEGVGSKHCGNGTPPFFRQSSKQITPFCKNDLFYGGSVQNSKLLKSKKVGSSSWDQYRHLLIHTPQCTKMT